MSDVLTNARVDALSLGDFATAQVPFSTNRLGVQFRTIYGINQAFDEMQSGELTAQAVDAAGRAEAAAEQAYTAGRIYETSAAGQADTELVDGDYYLVVSADSDEVFELWRKGASAPTDAGKRTVSDAYVQNIFQKFNAFGITQGLATTVGSTDIYVKNVDYESSTYMPVKSGMTVLFTGVVNLAVPVKGFDADKKFVSDLFTSSSQGRVLVENQPISIPSGVSYIIASSAFDNSASSGSPTSPLIVRELDLNHIVDFFTNKTVQESEYSIVGEVVTGEQLLKGGVDFYDSNVDYERSSFIPVTEGELLFCTGVGSSGNGVIKGFDENLLWVADLVVPTASRQLIINRRVVIPQGISYVMGCSAFDNTAGSNFPTSPLVIERQASTLTIENLDKRTSLSNYHLISPEIIEGEVLNAGGFNTESNVDYNRTGFIPVIEGEVVLYTGVSSPANPAVMGLDENKNWHSDLYTTSATRQLVRNIPVKIPPGVSYIMACSAVDNTAGSDFPTSPILLSRLRVFSIATSAPRGAQAQEALTSFRSMAYNIYHGGRDETGLDAVMKHIYRTHPDIISVQEAGDVGDINPLLKKAGFKYFYGPGGRTGLYFASKHVITYTDTFSSVDWNRKPLYTEVNINGKTIGVVSIHLDSSCGGSLCHDPDYLNVEPVEPAAQRRCIQMYQIMAELNARKQANPDLSGFIVQGDYNAIHNEANVLEYTDPIDETSLPAGLSYPLANAQFPFKQFEFYNGKLNLITKGSANGENITWWGPPESPNPVSGNFEHRLDYIAYSDNILIDKSEVINSRSDNALPDAGIRKYGEELNQDDGYIASDHIPVIADFIIT